MESRRAFLGRCGAGAAVWTALGANGWSGVSDAAAAFDTDRLGELAAFAMERARSAGATYADIRINRYRSRDVDLRVQADRATGKPVEVPSVSDAGSFGFGLRVLADGAWGFSASHEVTREAIARAAAEAVEIARANAPLRTAPIRLAATPTYRDTYRTKIVTDPLSVPVEQSLELLREVAAEARKVEGVFSVIASISARLEDRFFVSSEGSSTSTRPRPSSL
jgi:TldD protein